MEGKKRILVTGGAGFIGSSLVRHLINETDSEVLVLDSLTYAANLLSLRECDRDSRFRFLRGDICDEQVVRDAFRDFRPDVVFHLAAESHVDRSVEGPRIFLETNIMGTCTLLQAARERMETASAEEAARFRFIHVSTDEVFGSLSDEGSFHEDTAYDPSSPYSASKAAADHIVRAWGRTFGLPVMVTNCSNNYGPRQFPEKLIPLMILNALDRKPLPVYGTGENVRDWLYVDDHAKALSAVAEKGQTGRTYLIGGDAERKNLDVVLAVCDLVDDLSPDGSGSRRELIEFVADRPGHDYRYSIDASSTRKLGWAPSCTFEDGLRRTVSWYLENPDWIESVRTGAYRDWLDLNYATR